MSIITATSDEIKKEKELTEKTETNIQISRLLRLEETEIFLLSLMVGALVFGLLFIAQQKFDFNKITTLIFAGTSFLSIVFWYHRKKAESKYSLFKKHNIYPTVQENWIQLAIIQVFSYSIILLVLYFLVGEHFKAIAFVVGILFLINVGKIFEAYQQFRIFKKFKTSTSTEI